MADGNLNSNLGILESLGEEIVRIVAPAVTEGGSGFASIAYSEKASDFFWDKLLNSLVFVSVITVLTFLLVLLFYFHRTRFYVPIDVVTFSLLVFNFFVVGVLVACWFTFLPEWTTWALLIAMSLYNLAAVLLPRRPLRLLVELAITVYEARRTEPSGGGKEAMERKEGYCY